MDTKITKRKLVPNLVNTAKEKYKSVWQRVRSNKNTPEKLKGRMEVKLIGETETVLVELYFVSLELFFQEISVIIFNVYHYF